METTMNTEHRVMGHRSLVAVLAAVAGLAVPACAQVDDTHPAQPPAASPDQPAQSALAFDSVMHDFGRIMDTADVEHVFKFTNKGESTVILTEPKGSCGCTVPKLAKFEYSPGESGEIKVIFKPAGKAGPKNTQTITVNYHDTSRPNEPMPGATLTIQAEVRTAVSVEPKGALSFGEVVQGASPTQVITVTGIDPEFAVTYVSAARSRLFGTRILETKDVEINGEKLRQSRVEVTLKDTSKRGRMQSLATFRTTDPNVQLASLQIDAEVVGDIKVLPARLNIGAVEPKQTFERTFKVMSRGGKPFKITGIEQASASGQMTFDTPKPLDAAEGVGYSVVLKGVSPEAVGSLDATITVKTDVEEKLEIKAVGAVRPPPPLPPTGPMGPTLEPPGPSTTTTPPGGGPPIRDGGGL
jgi:hypothetical protein